MTRNRKLLMAGAATLAIAAGSVGIAQAVGGGDDSDEQVTGPDADRAKRAALESVGGGRVVGVEHEDDGRAGWEIEVKRSDGSEVEVHLNQNLERVGLESDDDGAEDEREGEDDD
jgi:uncharacterized membrane protein YkoI